MGSFGHPVLDTQTVHVPDDLYSVPRPTRPGQTFFLSSPLLSDNLSLLSLFEAKERHCPTSKVREYLLYCTTCNHMYWISVVYVDCLLATPMQYCF